MLKIRFGKIGDIDNYLKCQHEAFPHESPKRHRKYFLEKISKKEVLVAEYEGNYAGHVTYNKPGTSPPFYNSVYLEELAVFSKFRKRKFGTELVNEITRISRKLKAERIILDTQDEPDNKAVRFYEKHGFKRIGGITVYRNQAFYCLELK
jgi:ribosomal protein S18 acetylase RimI-like enzyme